MPDGIASIANKIREVEILGIPLGEAVLGGGSALIVAELTDAIVTPRLPNVPVAAVKGAEAFIMSRWGHRVFGAGGARIATMFLTYEAVRALIPIDDWVKQLIARITGGGGGNEIATATETHNPSSAGGNGHSTEDGMDALRMAVLQGGGQ